MDGLVSTPLDQIKGCSARLERNFRSAVLAARFWLTGERWMLWIAMSVVLMVEAKKSMVHHMSKDVTRDLVWL